MERGTIVGNCFVTVKVWCFKVVWFGSVSFEQPQSLPYDLLFCAACCCMLPKDKSAAMWCVCTPSQSRPALCPVNNQALLTHDCPTVMLRGGNVLAHLYEWEFFVQDQTTAMLHTSLLTITCHTTRTFIYNTVYWILRPCQLVNIHWCLREHAVLIFWDFALHSSWTANTLKLKAESNS